MKRAIVITLGILAFGPMAWAEDPKAPQDQAAYLDQLQVKLDHAAQRANQPSGSGTAVVGLRGSKQEPLSKQLYWKGKNGDKPATPDEVKLLRDAVEQAQAGKTDDAVAGLKSFMEKYPDSAFKSDAEETLKILASATVSPNAAPAAAPVPPKA